MKNINLEVLYIAILVGCICCTIALHMKEGANHKLILDENMDKIFRGRYGFD